MNVYHWFITPFAMKDEKFTDHCVSLSAEVWEVEIFICPGDSMDDNVPYIYLQVFLWAVADTPITHRMIDDWLSEHFEVVEIKSYKKRR